MPRVAKLEHRGKVKYSTLEEAQQVAALLQNRIAIGYRGLGVYKCCFCGYYHVGHDITAPVYDNSVVLTETYSPLKRKAKKRQTSNMGHRKYKRIKKQDLVQQIDSELDLMDGDLHDNYMGY